ncbi:hypothetical protein MRX96_029559 [Rhipicephalus microplus]
MEPGAVGGVACRGTTPLAFLLLHAGYVSQWAFRLPLLPGRRTDPSQRGPRGGRSSRWQVVLGRIIPLTRMVSSRSTQGNKTDALPIAEAYPAYAIPRGLRSFFPLALAIATMAKARGYFYAAAAAQGFLVSAIAEAVCPIDDVDISVWQGCASHVILDAGGRASGLPALRHRHRPPYGSCLLRGRSRVPADVLTRTTTQRAASRTALALPRPSGQSLNSRLLWLAFYAESSSRVAMTVSSVCIQTTAILARVAFPAVVEIPCYQYMSSLPILLVVRLLLEQLAASQASRWPQSCGRLVFLFSGYIVSSMALLLHFQTYVHQGGLVRAAHDARLRYVTLVHGRSSETHLGDASGRLRFFPVLLFRALGFVSAAMLVWPVGRIDQFDGALAWASLALMLGCSAATISFVAAALRPSRMRVRS